MCVDAANCGGQCSECTEDSGPAWCDWCGPGVPADTCTDRGRPVCRACAASAREDDDDDGDDLDDEAYDSDDSPEDRYGR